MVRIGIGVPAAVPGRPAVEIAQWAAESEAAGFDSLGAIDRLVYDNLEPLIVLATAAAVTKRVELLTTVLNVGWRNNPALLGKQLGTLDALSGGRLTAGLGLGSWPEDFETSGVSQRGMGKALDETVETMRRVWSGELSGLAGPMTALPADRPGLLFGGFVPAAHARVARSGAGWVAPSFNLDLMKIGMAAVREEWAKAGRDGAPRIVSERYFSLGPGGHDTLADYLATYYGSADDPYVGPILADSISTEEQLRVQLDALLEAGCDDVVLLPASAALAEVDLLADAVRRWRDGTRKPRAGSASTGAALAAGLTGGVLEPGDPGFDEELVGFDRSVRHAPRFVVTAATAEDVAVAIRFAGEHGLGVAVQSTGHGISVPADGALLISTKRLTGFTVDPETATARVAAGVLWHQVIDEAARHGLAPLSGSVSEVGVVSYTLGGGLGALGRLHGYAADHVRAIDVVTPDGVARRATESENPDLFWGLRGGKGNFGAVTALEFDLVPLGRFHGGALYFTAEDTPAVLHAYREWAPKQPDELTSSWAMVTFPDLPALPEAIRGRFGTHLRVIHLGPVEEGERLVGDLRAAIGATPVLDTFAEISYPEVSEVYGGTPEPGAYHINTFQLTDLDHDVVEVLLAQAGPDSERAVEVEITQVGGALGRPPAVPNAVAHRAHPFQLFSVSVLDGVRDDESRAAHARFVEATAPWNTGHRILNFMAGVAHTDPADVRMAYTDESYARLVALKTRWDPGNMFRFNHNIPPLAER